MGFYLGVDGGTGGIRARLFNLNGHCLANAATSYTTQFGAVSHAEQDPEDWWRAMARSVRQAVADSGVPASQIEAMALDTTCCSVVALDEKTRPVRPAIIWMDVRAGKEADAVLATGDVALGVNGAGHGPVSAEWMIPKSLWMKRHEPELFARAATVCEYQDFMTMRLTGRRAASLDNVSIRWHYASERGGWPSSLLAKLGLEELQQKWPQEVLAPGEVIGPLTAEASEHLGLPRQVKVVQGGADALIGMIGLGVAKPGQLALITGTSHLQFGVCEHPVHMQGLWGTYKDAVYPDRYILEGGQTSTGSIIEWLRRLTHDSPDLAALNVEAAKLEPGADGLLVLDHFQGNRTPHTDPLSRGAIIGLSLHHTSAHIFRAIMEAIGFGTRAIVDRFTEAGCGTDEIVVGGGATRSDLFLQIHADTAGRTFIVPEEAEAPSLGAAILAATGAGRFASIDEGIAAMTRPGRRIEPRPHFVEQYNEIYQRYVALYPALKALRAPV